MKVFHNVIVNVFIKPEENYDEIKQAFLKLFPFDIAESKVQVSETNASTFEQRTIKIIEVVLHKEALINKLMEFTKEKMSEDDKKMIVRQLDSRVDDEVNFFFRLGKNRLLNGEYVVVDHGNCFHFKCHVAAFPKKKEVAITVIKDYFEK